VSASICTRSSRTSIVATCVSALLVEFLIGCSNKRESGKTPSAGDSASSIRILPNSGNSEDQLISALRDSFQTRNAKLDKVRVLDLKTWDMDYLGPRIVLGWAIVRDMQFHDSFNDEMFGVFVVNGSLTRVEHVVDIFPTKSWFNEEVHFGALKADSIEVLGQDGTYGGPLTRRAYKWR